MRIGSKSLLQSLCLAYMIAWGISPPLQIGTGFRVVLIVCFFTWNLIAIEKCGYTLLKFELGLFAFLALMIGIAWLSDGFTAGVVGNLQVIVFFCYLCVFNYFYITGEKPLWVLAFILLLLAIWNCSTLIGFTSQRNVARLMAKEFAGMEQYMKRGIGGYGYVYSIVFALPILTWILLRHLKEYSILLKMLIIFDLFTSAFLVMKAGYSIAVIISIIAVAVTVVYKHTNNSQIIVALMVLVALAVIINLEGLLTSLLPYVSGTMYERKVEDMLLSLSSDAAVGTVDGRTERYIRSIRLFFQSPIWGQLSRVGVGKHSAILDRFAQFGIFIGGLFTHYVIYAQKRLMRNCVDCGIALAVFIATTMLFMLNNIAYSMGVIIFVMYPVFVNIANAYASSLHE